MTLFNIVFLFEFIGYVALTGMALQFSKRSVTSELQELIRTHKGQLTG